MQTVLIYLSNRDLSAPCLKTQLAGSALLRLALLWPRDGLTAKQSLRCRQQQLATTNMQPKARVPCDLNCFRWIVFNVGTPGNMWSLLRPAERCKLVLLCNQKTFASAIAFADRDGTRHQAMPHTWTSHPNGKWTPTSQRAQYRDSS